ncbi:hypothetical protein VTN96DRAFT_10316 [Rasamsonia emersonii]
MHIPNIVLASTNFTRAGSLPAAINQFLVECFPAWSLISSSININPSTYYRGDGDGSGIASWIEQRWSELMEWVAQPHILAIIIAWAITFTVVMFFILSLGFGPAGIVAGSLAAAFQSLMYGGFTPAGGIFATLTSMAMLGTLMWPAAVFAAVLATVVAAIVGVMG